MELEPLINHEDLPDMPSASNSDHDGRYVPYSSLAADVYTFDTASLTLATGTLTALVLTDGFASITGGAGTGFNSLTVDTLTIAPVAGIATIAESASQLDIDGWRGLRLTATGPAGIVTIDNTWRAAGTCIDLGTVSAATSITTSALISATANTLINGTINDMVINASPIGLGTAAAGTFTTVKVGDGLVGTPSITFTNDPDTGFYSVGGNDFRITANGIDRIRIRGGANQVIFASGQTIAFSSSGVGLTNGSLIFGRDGDDTFKIQGALGGLPAASTMKIYGVADTFATATNYERLSISHDGSVIDFISEAGGTGSATDFRFSGGKFITADGRRKNTTVYTSDPAPVPKSDHEVFGETDSAGFTVTLSAGVEGATHRIVNIGVSGKNLTVAPASGEELFGVVDETFILFDGEAIILTWTDTKGWN